jgi:hypothetical protein
MFDFMSKKKHASGIENDSSPVTIIPIQDLDEARFLADVIEIVYKRRPKLRAVLNDIWLSRKEAEEGS